MSKVTHRALCNLCRCLVLAWLPTRAMGAERRHVLVHDNGRSLVGHDDRSVGECARERGRETRGQWSRGRRDIDRGRMTVCEYSQTSECRVGSKGVVVTESSATASPLQSVHGVSTTHVASDRLAVLITVAPWLTCSISNVHSPCSLLSPPASDSHERNRTSF
jgi:hypothetical protein